MSLNQNSISCFWDSIIRRGNVKIILGSQFSYRYERLGVGNWDIQSTGILISYLLRRSPKIDVKILDPLPQFEWKKNKNETDKITKEWGNCDLIFLGSPDANLGSAIVMDHIFNTFGEKRTVIKERTNSDINQFPFALREYFNNDTSKIHNACKFNKFCKRKQSPNKKTANREFRTIHGVVFSTFNDKNEIIKEHIIGNCIWLYQRTDKAQDYLAMCHVIILNNPYCKQEDCK